VLGSPRCAHRDAPPQYIAKRAGDANVTQCRPAAPTEKGIQRAETGGGRWAAGAGARGSTARQRSAYGAVRDPLKSLVDAGSERDIETIMVDGRSLVENRQPLVVDEEPLIRDIQASAEEMGGCAGVALARRDCRAHDADELTCPPSASMPSAIAARAPDTSAGRPSTMLPDASTPQRRVNEKSRC
jgi:hypothetical protein